MPTALIIDDEELIRWSVRERLRVEGFESSEAGSAGQARKLLNGGAGLVLLDVGLPDASGIDLIAEIRRADPDVPIIMMTADDSAATAVAALKAGAFHYLTKPLNLEELALQAARALETTRLRREVRRLHERQAEGFGIEQIIGASAAMVEARRLLAKIAASPATTVLITGESGTGKDLAAKSVHYGSERKGAQFVNITCSALPEALLESELFGHEKGAFTDARQQKIGLFEQADTGSVFLDEIGEMSPVLQAKLLRVLEERAFRRVGGNTDIRVNVRVIAATNRTLREEVKKGRFREDLYYRLNVLSVELPPLRERAGDIPLLAEYFTQRFAREFRNPVTGIDKQALELLQGYSWPGNIRELRNAIERAVLLAEGDTLRRDQFAALDKQGELPADFKLPAGGVKLEYLERSLVAQALERTKGNQSQAARLLGINRDQMRYRIEKFGLGRSE